jgi:hypothetical protein
MPRILSALIGPAAAVVVVAATSQIIVMKTVGFQVISAGNGACSGSASS